MSDYSAARIPYFAGPAAWSAILPDQGAPVFAAGAMRADFVIIGGGFAGLSAARRLRLLEPKASIIVLEAGRIAEGASGRNSGFMIDLPHEIQTDNYASNGASTDRKQINLNRKAIRFAGENVEAYGIDRNFYDPVGKVNGAASARADALNRSYAEHLATMGEPSDYLDAKAMQELTGSSHYVGGLYTPGAVMIQPAGYIRGLADGLRRDGVRVFENAPVTRIARAGDSWTASGNGYSVTASRAILTNNGHLESFGFARQRLMHIFLYASMTIDLGAETLKKLGGQPRWGITPSDPMGTTMRRIDGPLGGNRIITRTCARFLPDMRPDNSELKRTARVHEQKFNDRFPALRGVRQEFTWAGHLCLSRNGVAVTRELDTGLFAGCVQNGLGTVRGTMTGMAAAELACGVESDFTRHFLAEAEPSVLPPPPISTIGANLYLRWKEWRGSSE